MCGATSTSALRMPRCHPRVWRSDVAVDALLGDVAEIAGAGEHTSRGKRRTTGRWEMMDLGASPCSCRR
jgi:hypothetical protein